MTTAIAEMESRVITGIDDFRYDELCDEIAARSTDNGWIGAELAADRYKAACENRCPVTGRPLF